MQDSYDLTLRIQRYDPESGRSWVQEYSLMAGRIQRFVDLFRRINQNLDTSLAWNSSCEHGQCGSCSVVVNGKPLLACELLVENAVEMFGTTVFNIQPLKNTPTGRDLMIDFISAYDKVHRAKPYLLEPRKPRPEEGLTPITPRSMDFYVEATRCINCFCCASACISGKGPFLGPNALLATIVKAMDQRETNKEEHLRVIYGPDGVARCHTSRACSHVCPKEIDVAHFLALAKQGRFSEGEQS
jgi:succinate dehydrogenase / fumarate reductase, iron-sulfur subunit